MRFRAFIFGLVITLVFTVISAVAGADSLPELPTGATANPTPAPINDMSPSPFPPPSSSSNGQLPETVQSSSSPANTGFITLAPSFAVLQGVLGFGGGLDLMFKTSQNLPLYVGLESGFYHFFVGDNYISSTLNTVPAMISAMYQFEIPESKFHPYLGISVGASLDWGQLNYFGWSYYNTQVLFMGLVKPGFAIALTPGVDFSVEPKLGLIKDQFIFLPQLGFSFKF